MYKVIGKFTEDAEGMERQTFKEIMDELGLIGSLSADVGDLECYYDNNGNTYVVASNSENYYGIGHTERKKEKPMMDINMENLIKIFLRAKELDMKYVAILVEMTGFPKPEMIINTTENIDAKLAYYQKTYDDDLNHKFSPGIKIINFTFANELKEIDLEWREYFM